MKWLKASIRWLLPEELDNDKRFMLLLTAIIVFALSWDPLVTIWKLDTDPSDVHRVLVGEEGEGGIKGTVNDNNARLSRIEKHLGIEE